ncbi:hypothetical protein [Salana multivorans]
MDTRDPAGERSRRQRLGVMLGVSALGLLLTAIACYQAISGPPTYWTRTEVVFLTPSSAANPNSLRTRSEDVIITAGAVAKVINGATPPQKYASPEVNLIGTTTATEAVSISLPDTGGQWAPHFTHQLLVVEAKAPSPERAEQLRDTAIEAIENTLDRMQREAGVASVNDMTAVESPESPVVVEVRPSRMRALAMTGLLGLWMTVVAATTVSRGRPAWLEPPIRAASATT